MGKGIIIGAVVTLIVTTFGIRVFHTYERYFHLSFALCLYPLLFTEILVRYAFIPTLIATCILYSQSAPRFDLTTPSSGDPSTIIASRSIVTWKILFFDLADW